MATITGKQGFCRVDFYQHYFGDYVNTSVRIQYLIKPHINMTDYFPRILQCKK